MAIWKPRDIIKAKVLGIVWRGPELLAAEVYDSDGALKGVRPLGGSAEFGETREEALRREFKEELGCSITISSTWHFFENIFVHEGALGHEMIFAAKIELDNEELYRKDRITFFEIDGHEEVAGWFTLQDLASKEIPLFPNGLSEALAAPDGCILR
ncbi:NUDIX hydrolase [Oryzifoliimicrobium ureilyticus]|uniref:NUDIX hydrolase n=1 Tax=Oryzifoliimicrobium ureilyticus TaxID=3113724 RepID=UPI003076815F